MVCVTFVFIALVPPLEETAHDRLTKMRSAVTCVNRYNGCLNKLIRKSDRNYYAICKGKENE